MSRTSPFTQLVRVGKGSYLGLDAVVARSPPSGRHAVILPRSPAVGPRAGGALIPLSYYDAQRQGGGLATSLPNPSKPMLRCDPRHGAEEKVSSCAAEIPRWWRSAFALGGVGVAMDNALDRTQIRLVVRSLCVACADVSSFHIRFAVRNTGVFYAAACM